MIQHSFGGNWTEDKLNRLRKYLEAYTQLFEKNERARHFKRIYVDAFAGTGSRIDASTNEGDQTLDLFDGDTEVAQFLKGSVSLALEVVPPFHEYIFIEKLAPFASELDEIRDSYPHLTDRITILHGDANRELVKWTRQMNTKKERAVVFLDPYGMQVDWTTLEALAMTEAIDIWILFPLGQAVNRLLTRNDVPPDTWASRLTSFFGTDEWINVFYAKSAQETLFDLPVASKKIATYDTITEFFVMRLETIFKGVTKNPLILRNSRNSPIFVLCFASSNPKGTPTAIKIANSLLKEMKQP